jgi:hypothetical protein
VPAARRAERCEQKLFATLTREYVACEERETKAAKFRKVTPDLASFVPMKTR